LHIEPIAHSLDYCRSCRDWIKSFSRNKSESSNLFPRGLFKFGLDFFGQVACMLEEIHEKTRNRQKNWAHSANTSLILQMAKDVSQSGNVAAFRRFGMKRFLGLLSFLLLFSLNLIASESVQEDEIFQLPAPDEKNSESGIRTLVYGEKLSMDELGPIIINPDGTMRRIANWKELTKGEQESTFRQISARNKKRIEALNEAAASALSHERGEQLSELREEVQLGEQDNVM
jgi:hypothetical protein